MEPLPIACSLETSDFEARRIEWADALRHATDRRAVDGGVEIAFPGGAEVTQEIESLIAKEQSCCGWMAMRLSDGDPDQVLRITSGDPMGERQIRAWF